MLHDIELLDEAGLMDPRNQTINADWISSTYIYGAMGPNVAVRLYSVFLPTQLIVF